MMDTRRSLGTLLFAIAIAAVAFTPSCGGGPSGTARSTVQGNVAAVEQAMRRSPRDASVLARVLGLFRPVRPAWAQTGLDGIRVSIEGTPYETETSETGDFVLESPFAGQGTLLFVRENDQLVGRLGVDVPAGGSVTLRNVRCGRDSGSCRADAVEVEQPSPSEPSDASVPSPSGGSGSPIGVSEPSEPSVSEPSPIAPSDPSPPTVSGPAVSEPSVSEPSVSEDAPSDD